MKYSVNNHIVRFEENTINENGQYTAKKHIRIIMPDQDISEESEQVQAIVNAARIGYAEQEVLNE